MNVPFHRKALAPGTRLGGWIIEEVLGAGRFTTTYRARSADGRDRAAIKEYYPSAAVERPDGITVAAREATLEPACQDGLRAFVEEAHALAMLSKPIRLPHIVAVRDVIEANGTAYMVTDFEEAISLELLLDGGRRFDEEALTRMLRQLCASLSAAHRVGIVHRDIRPANILIDVSGRPILIDFVAGRFDLDRGAGGRLTAFTPPYAAIEQYVPVYPQGPWTDIYALGAVLSHCVTGEEPAEVLARGDGERQRLADSKRSDFSPAFLALIDAAFQVAPQRRPATLEAWLAALPDGHEVPARSATTPTSPEAERTNNQASARPGQGVPDEPDEAHSAVPSATTSPTPAAQGEKPWRDRRLLGYALAIAAAVAAILAGTPSLDPPQPEPAAPARPAVSTAERRAAASPAVPADRVTAASTPAAANSDAEVAAMIGQRHAQALVDVERGEALARAAAADAAALQAALGDRRGRAVSALRDQSDAAIAAISQSRSRTTQLIERLARAGSLTAADEQRRLINVELDVIARQRAAIGVARTRAEQLATSPQQSTQKPHSNNDQRKLDRALAAARQIAADVEATARGVDEPDDPDKDAAYARLQQVRKDARDQEAALDRLAKTADGRKDLKSAVAAASDIGASLRRSLAEAREQKRLVEAPDPPTPLTQARSYLAKADRDLRAVNASYMTLRAEVARFYKRRPGHPRNDYTNAWARDIHDAVLDLRKQRGRLSKADTVREAQQRYAKFTEIRTEIEREMSELRRSLTSRAARRR